MTIHRTNIGVIQAEWPHNSVICHDSGFWGQISELSKRSGRTTRDFVTIRGSGGKIPSYPSGVAAQLGFLPRFGLLGANIRVIQAVWPHNSGFCHDSGFWGQISELSKRSGRTTRFFATIRASGDKYPSYPSGVAAQLGYLPRFGVLGTNFSIFQAQSTHFRNFCPDPGVRWTKFSLFQAPGTHFRNFCPDQGVRWTKLLIFEAPTTSSRYSPCPSPPKSRRRGCLSSID